MFKSIQNVRDISLCYIKLYDGKVWEALPPPPPREKEFLKNRGEMNVSGDDLKTEHVETSGVDLVIRL